MVLLFLGVVWVAVLFSWLRSRTEGTFSDSVSTFSRNLSVLERSAPHTVPAANRMRVGRPVSSLSPPPRNVARSAAGRPGLRSVPSPALRQRQVARKRRRDVLFVLVVAVLVTAVLAVFTRSHVAELLQVLLDLSLAGYVSLLVRMRNLAAERELKLSRLPARRVAPRTAPARSGYVAGSYGELAMRRAAN